MKVSVLLPLQRRGANSHHFKVVTDVLNELSRL